MGLIWSQNAGKRWSEAQNWRNKRLRISWGRDHRWKKQRWNDTGGYGCFSLVLFWPACCEPTLWESLTGLKSVGILQHRKHKAKCWCQLTARLVIAIHREAIALATLSNHTFDHFIKQEFNWTSVNMQQWNGFIWFLIFSKTATLQIYYITLTGCESSILLTNWSSAHFIAGIV